MHDLDVFETERLVLSGWRADQLGDLLRLHGDATVTRYLTRNAPWTGAEAIEALNRWIELFSTRRLGKLRVRRKSDGVLVGRAGFGILAMTGEPELGYALYPEHWGNGYAFEAARGLRDWIFRETDWDHFIGLADIRNRASLAVLSKIGMTKTHVETVPDGRRYQFHIHRRPGT